MRDRLTTAARAGDFDLRVETDMIDVTIPPEHGGIFIETAPGMSYHFIDGEPVSEALFNKVVSAAIRASDVERSLARGQLPTPRTANQKGLSRVTYLLRRLRRK